LIKFNQILIKILPFHNSSTSIVGSIAAEGLSATAFIGRALLELSTVKV